MITLTQSEDLLTLASEQFTRNTEGREGSESLRKDQGEATDAAAIACTDALTRKAEEWEEVIGVCMAELKHLRAQGTKV